MPPPIQRQAAAEAAVSSHIPSWLDSWHVNPAVNRDYDFIDGLRGIAILMVLACHLIYINPNSGAMTHFIGAFCGAGAGGVVLFFALSGFLISWPFWKNKFNHANQVAPRRYAQRRFWKIYPPLVLSLIILTPIYVWLRHDRSYWVIAGKWLAGIPFLIPVSGKLNPVMWTLVVEVQFYITLPLIFLIIKRVPARVCLWMVPLVFLVVPAVFREFTGLKPTDHPLVASHYPSALDAFCLGILLAGLDVTGALRKSWAALGIYGLLLWPVVMGLMAWTQTHAELQGLPLDNSLPWLEKIASGLALCLVANPQHPVARWLCAPWLRWCGLVSYEWYLFHQPILNWARQLVGPAHGSPAVYAGIVGGSLLVSGILSASVYRFYSLPILKYGRVRK